MAKKKAAKAKEKAAKASPMPPIVNAAPLFVNEDSLNWSVGPHLGQVAVLFDKPMSRIAIDATIAPLLCGLVKVYAKHLDLFSKPQEGEPRDIGCTIGALEDQRAVLITLPVECRQICWTKRQAIYAAARIEAELKALK